MKIEELINEKLQEQLNIAKMALTRIKLRTERDELETYYVERNHDIHKDAIDALAAIGEEVYENTLEKDIVQHDVQETINMSAELKELSELVAYFNLKEVEK